MNQIEPLGLKLVSQINMNLMDQNETQEPKKASLEFIYLGHISYI